SLPGGEPLPEKAHHALAHSLHWLYGTTWPTLLGLAARPLGLRTRRDFLVAGAGLGAAVWAIGYLGWLPAAGLVRPVHRERPSRTLSGLASHVAYGMVTALPLAFFGGRFLGRRARLERLFARLGWR